MFSGQIWMSWWTFTDVYVEVYKIRRKETLKSKPVGSVLRQWNSPKMWLRVQILLSKLAQCLVQVYSDPFIFY